MLPRAQDDADLGSLPLCLKASAPHILPPPPKSRISGWLGAKEDEKGEMIHFTGRVPCMQHNRSSPCTSCMFLPKKYVMCCMCLLIDFQFWFFLLYQVCKFSGIAVNKVKHQLIQVIHLKHDVADRQLIIMLQGPKGKVIHFRSLPTLELIFHVDATNETTVFTRLVSSKNNGSDIVKYCCVMHCYNYDVLGGAYKICVHSL